MISDRFVEILHGTFRNSRFSSDFWIDFNRIFSKFLLINFFWKYQCKMQEFYKVFWFFNGFLLFYSLFLFLFFSLLSFLSLFLSFFLFLPPFSFFFQFLLLFLPFSILFFSFRGGGGRFPPSPLRTPLFYK